MGKERITPTLRPTGLSVQDNLYNLYIERRSDGG